MDDSILKEGGRMTIEWRPGMTIDNGAIDDDHRYLISLINDYECLMAEGFDQTAILKILDSLRYYTIYHFTREEATQRAVDYPSAESHAAEHKRLIDCVDYAIRLLSRDITSDRREEIKGQVARLLQNWLISHILKHDVTMRPYARNIRTVMGKAPPISSA